MQSDAEESATTPENPRPQHERASAAEYYAMVAVQVAENLEGVAAARTTKPRKATTQDANVAEHLIYNIGGEDAADGDDDLDKGTLKHQ